MLVFVLILILRRLAEMLRRKTKTIRLRATQEDNLKTSNWHGPENVSSGYNTDPLFSTG